MAMKRRRSKVRGGNLFLKFAIVFLMLSVAGVTVMGFMYNSSTNNSNIPSIANIITSADDEMNAIVDVDVIYNNIYINDVNVGGLTKEKALEKINERYQPELDGKAITFHNGEDNTVFKFTDFNARYNFSQAVDEAYQYAREGSLKERYDKIMDLDDKPYKITADPVYSYDKSRIEDILGPIEESIYIAPVNASIARENGVFTISKGAVGQRLNKEQAAQDMDKLLASKQGGSVEAHIEEVLPQYTSADLEQAQSLLGSFTTSFSGGSSDRNTNIATAASKINNAVIYPGEVFSTNAAFGPSTYENGYRSAGVIVGGKITEDIGGGVCQVSSTLYNALLFAELEIVERQNHSLKVGYVDYGFDATLAGDYIDLKFRNNTKLPVVLESIMGSSKLTVNVYGYEGRSSARKVVFKNELVETVEPSSEVVTKDPTLPLDEKKVVAAAKTGYKYNVYKIVYENDKEIERVKINSSNYKPVAAEVHIGTGEAVVESELETDAEADASVQDGTEDSAAVAGGQGSEETPSPELDTTPEPTPAYQEPEPEQQTPQPQVDDPGTDEVPFMPDI